MRCAVVGVIGFVVTSAAVATHLTAAGQQPMFRSAVELVIVRVTVTDRDKRPITGLSRQDFVVLENGTPQSVSQFLSAEVPVDVALMLDTSSSVKPMLSRLRRSAMRFLRHLRPRDRGMVVRFGDRTEILANLTSDRAALMRAVDGLYARGDTRLYDGIYVTLGALLPASRDFTRRNALVVLSDGRDTTSHLGIEDVRGQAVRSGVPIYPILIADDVGVPQLDFKQVRAIYDITTLARDSGGRVIRLEEPLSLDDAYGQIARELAQQYVLAFPAATPNRDSRIVVEVPSRPDVVTRVHVGFVRRKPII